MEVWLRVQLEGGLSARPRPGRRLNGKKTNEQGDLEEARKLLQSKNRPEQSQVPKKEWFPRMLSTAFDISTFRIKSLDGRPFLVTVHTTKRSGHSSRPPLHRAQKQPAKDMPGDDDALSSLLSTLNSKEVHYIPNRETRI